MSRIVSVGPRSLVMAAVFAAGANAQRQPATVDHAPVPRQVLTARTAFIGNGGGESYGADSYFDLTKYDGGPNRTYDTFYAAVSDWGHYDLVESTNDADVVLVVKFANPIVAHGVSGAGDTESSYSVYDPQFNLSINDPRTGLALWTITEHIEPADDKQKANRHFDDAITRLVEDLKRLILTPDLVTSAENILPAGALHVRELRHREGHLGWGMLFGSVTGTLIASQTANYSCPDDFNRPLTPADAGVPPKDFFCSSRRGQTKMRNQLVGALGGAIAGGLVGWFWPVSF